MHQELRNIPEHMLSLGLGALAHSVWHAAYYSMQNDKWPYLSVLQAAHAAEILIKARIAEEHPLLIFDNLPRSKKVSEDLLEIKHLIENAKTVQYSDLPELLWATTGIKLQGRDIFEKFGKLRNTIQHFSFPNDVDCSQEALEFIFEVIDPFISQCWGLYAIDYNEDYEPYEYLIATLINRGILFNVSNSAAKDFKHVEVNWPENLSEYQIEMQNRFSKVLSENDES